MLLTEFVLPVDDVQLAIDVDVDLVIPVENGGNPVPLVPRQTSYQCSIKKKPTFFKKVGF